MSTRVLIVDDEPQIVRTLTLSARSYEVIGATTGRQALAIAATSQPDIVVLDLGLPYHPSRPRPLTTEPGMGYRFRP